MPTAQPPETEIAPVWAIASDQVLERVNAQVSGLQAAEARSRLERIGPNRLPEKPPHSSWAVLVAQFKGFLSVLLLSTALVAWAIGDLKDALMIAAVTVFNGILGFVQEYRAENALGALTRLVAFRARVRRDGQVNEVPTDDLVPGDVVLLEAGDRVPADGRLFLAYSLEVDESSLTGESLPVQKDADALLPAAAQLAERINVVFMSALVTRGRGEFVVAATGSATEVGRIASMLEGISRAPTPLQIQLDHLGKRLALLALAVVAVISVFELVRGKSLAQLAIEAVALAVAAVPEGLPTVVTVTLALGVHRMARHKAIVKRLGAVETLGCTSVVCSDKTGTLTMNEMTVRGVWFAGRSFSVSGEGYGLDGEIIAEDTTDGPPGLFPILRPVVLCNDSRVENGILTGDPTEGALLTLAQKAQLDIVQLRSALPRVAEVPFESERRFMATFHRDADIVRIFVKGAPGALLDRSDTIITRTGTSALDMTQQEAVRGKNDQLAACGLRVLAVAVRELAAGEFDPKQSLIEHVTGLTFVGLVGMMDPPRVEARAAISLCKTAGISVKMITGDQRTTASAIASSLGLVGDALTGAEIDRMDETALASALSGVAVFARVAPEHKLRIVAALKAQGHVVAMTGDGVNDAPALRCADIGVAMGSGTEVAKAAASMVLADDNFATIVRAVHEGRTIYENIVKFVRFQLSTNLGALLTVFAAPFFDMPSPLGAAQILWVAMISDGPPAISLGMETPRAETMDEPPRRPSERILTGRRLAVLLFFGAIMTSGTLAALRIGLDGPTPNRASTLAFTTFVLYQVFNTFNVRSEHDTSINRQFFTNYRLWGALGVMITLQVAVVYWGPLQKVFGTTALSVTNWALCIAIASSIFFADELRKRIALPGRTIGLSPVR